MTESPLTPAFDVVVVGAGPVGLSAAIDLARRGRRVLVLEKRIAPSTQPRAHVVNARTMEIFRGWGVADAVRDAGLAPELARGFSWMTRMSEDAIATLDYLDEETAERHSPERLCSCPQDLIEEVLLRRLAAEPTAEVRFGVEVVDVLENSTTGVRLAVRSDAGESAVSARFAIGADGASSSVRSLVDAGVSRSDPLGRRVNIYFRGDLQKATRNRASILWFIMSLETSGIFISLNGTDRWVYSVEVDADLDVPAVFTPEYCTQLLRTATGVPDFEPEILSVLPWRVDMAIADRWRVGSVFLVGDAAHQFPPQGGFGMNSGIQDVHNLAWKLDAVLGGRAGDALLDSYEVERRDVAVVNANASMENARNQQEAAAFLADPNILRLLDSPDGGEIRAMFAQGVEMQRGEFQSQGQQFGFVYASGAVIDDGSTTESSTISRYVITSRPGARAPHVRLRDAAGAELSTIDLAADGWALLSAGGGSAWTRAAQQAAADTGTAVRAASIGEGHHDLSGTWDESYGLGSGGAVLVRPDGHVAARWLDAPADPAEAVTAAIRSTMAVASA